MMKMMMVMLTVVMMMIKEEEETVWGGIQGLQSLRPHAHTPCIRSVTMMMMIMVSILMWTHCAFDMTLNLIYIGETQTEVSE